MSTRYAVLHNRSLLIMGISESVSNVGNWITMLAVFALVVFKGEGSVAQSSGIFLAGLLPTLVFSPAAGWLADRFDRRLLMIASELLAGLSIAGLIFTTSLAWIYILLALQAVFCSLMAPARQAAIPDVIAREELAQANAFLQQLNAIIKIVAPLLAGFILTLLDPHRAIILDVISFGLSALILSRLPALPAHRPQKASSGQSAPAAPAALGLGRLLHEQPMLRLLFVATFLGILVIIGFDVLAPVFTRDVLQGDERFFGLVISLVGAGTLAAAVLLMLQKKADPWRGFTGGVLLLAFVPFTLAIAAALPGPSPHALLRTQSWRSVPGWAGVARAIVIAGSLVGGFGNGLLVVQTATLLQTLSPRPILGRVGGIFQSTAVAGQLAGMLLTPLLVPALLSIGTYFLFSGLLLGLLGAYTAWTVLKSRQSGVLLKETQSTADV